MITPKAVKIFSHLMSILCKTFLEIKGNIHLESYNQYFELKEKKGKFVFDKSKALMPWLREWAETELKDKEIDFEFNDEKGKVLFTQYKQDKQKARSRFLSSFPELYCVVKFKKPLHELVLDSANYYSSLSEYFSKPANENESFFKLVKMDNTFLTANWAKRIIQLAEYNSDSEFFINLSNALQTDGFRKDIKPIEYGLAVILLWYLGGKKLTYEKFQYELINLGYNDYEEFQDLGNFKKFVNRLGIRKYRKVRRK